MNCNEKKKVVRVVLNFGQLKELCLSYEKNMRNDFSIQKVHFMDLGNGKITVFYEDNKSLLYKIRELSYDYPDYHQICYLVRKAKEFLGSSYTISTKSRYENRPCFTISKDNS